MVKVYFIKYKLKCWMSLRLDKLNYISNRRTEVLNNSFTYVYHTCYGHHNIVQYIDLGYGNSRVQYVLFPQTSNNSFHMYPHVRNLPWLVNFQLRQLTFTFSKSRDLQCFSSGRTLFINGKSQVCLHRITLL